MEIRRTVSTKFDDDFDSDFSDSSSSEDELDETSPSERPPTPELPARTHLKHTRRPSGLPPPPPRIKSTVRPQPSPEEQEKEPAFDNFVWERDQKKEKQQEKDTTSNDTETIQRMGSGELKSKSKTHRINALRRIRLKIEATAAFKAGLKVEDKELEEKIPEKEEKESESTPKEATPTKAPIKEPPTSTSPKSRSKRQRVLQEIVETEKTFVINLSAFYHGYVEPIRLCDTPLKREIMNTNEIALLFSNVEQIVTLNTDFLKRLQTTIESWDTSVGGLSGDGPDECVGDFFLKAAPLFALYAQYTSNHDLAVDVMKIRFEDRGEYLALMNVCEAEAQTRAFQATGKTRPPQLVGYYLIMPVQRVPRYKMLLQELLKRTPEGHLDLITLPSAVAEVDKAAHKINETIRAREEKQKLAKLQTQFTSNSEINLVATDRKLLLEGQLIKVCRRDLREYYFHLFSDIMTYSKRKGGDDTATGKDFSSGSLNSEKDATYKLHRCLDLAATTVVDVIASDAEKNKVKYAFQIVSQQKSFMVSASTEKLKQQWMATISKAATSASDKQKQRRGSGTREVAGMAAAVWAADGTQNQCNFCNKQFTVVRRRHHCRSCGSLVCAACSPHRLLLRNIDPTNTVRVCNRCGHGIEKRLRHALRIEFQIHRLLPKDQGDQGVTTERYYVKVFENDTYVGTTEISTTDSIQEFVDQNKISNASDAGDAGDASNTGNASNAGDAGETDEKKSRPALIPDASDASTTKKEIGKLGCLAWLGKTSTFDFEIDHLTRGTDDAGKPHRIYLEMYAKGVNTSDALIGVGSISASDVLNCSSELHHPNPEQGGHVQKRTSMNIKQKPTPKKRSGSMFKRTKSMNEGEDDDDSDSNNGVTDTAIDAADSVATGNTEIVKLTSVNHLHRRSSVTNVVPNTPLAHGGILRDRALWGTSLPASSAHCAALVKMIQTTTGNTRNNSSISKDLDDGNTIRVMGELAVSVIVSTPLEMRRSDVDLSEMIQTTIEPWLPVELLNAMQWDNEDNEDSRPDALPSIQDSAHNNDNNDNNDGTKKEEKEEKNEEDVDSSSIHNSSSSSSTAATLSSASTTAAMVTPTAEVMSSHHAAALLLELAIDLQPDTLCFVENYKVLQNCLSYTNSMKRLNEWRKNSASSLSANNHDLPKEERAKLTDRARVVYDIVHTEKAYVRCLERLDDHFVQPYLVRHAVANDSGSNKHTSSSHELKKASSFFSRRKNSVANVNALNSGQNSASVMVCLQTVTQLKTLHREFLTTLQQRVQKTALSSTSTTKETLSESKSTQKSECEFQYSDDVLIGDLFERFGSLFRLYTQYQNNYDALMDFCRTDTILSETLTTFRMELFSQGSPLKDSTGRDTATSHMVKPMERMLVYSRLLSSALLLTNETHSDRQSLSAACAQLKEAQTHIKKTIHERENKDVILDIERSFVDPISLLIKGRSFVRRGPLTKVCRREDKEFYFWLFSDLLVYGHFVGNNKYKHHRSFELENVQVSNPTTHTPGTASSSELQKGRPCLTISSKNKSFVVYVGHEPDERSVYIQDNTASTIESEKSMQSDNNSETETSSSNQTTNQTTNVIVKPHHHSTNSTVSLPKSSHSLFDCLHMTETNLRDTWYEDIQRLTMKKDGNDEFVAPVWQTDKSAKGCRLCERGFTLTRRRHHCRICGLLVCNSCSPNRLVIASIDEKKKVRVCNKCKPLATTTDRVDRRKTSFI